MAARKVKRTALVRPEARQLRDTLDAGRHVSARDPLKIKSEALDDRLRRIHSEKRDSLVEVVG